MVKMAYKYFDGISDKLRVGNVLNRREIESTGYHIYAARTLTFQSRFQQHAVQRWFREEHVEMELEEPRATVVLDHTDA